MSITDFLWLIISLFALITLIAFAIKRFIYLLLAIFYRAKPNASIASSPEVLLIVPCRDEASVIEKNIKTVLSLDYPKEKLKVVYVDDGSTDGTTQILAQKSSELGFEWFRLETSEKRTKSRALNEALKRFGFGKFVYILDADFTPEQRALKIAVEILESKKLAMVTGKVVAEKPWANAICAYSAIEELVHQHITLSAQSKMGLGSAPMGGNYLIRRDVLEKLGGFDESALLEDVAIALKLFEQSERSALAPHAVAHHHVPRSAKTFFTQHYFWSRGFNQAAKSHFGEILSSNKLSVGKKLTALFFSLGYADRLAIILGIIASAGKIFKVNPFFPLWIWVVVFALPLAHVVAALSKEKRTDKLWSIFYLPLIFPLDIFAATKAAVDDILGKPLIGYKTRRE